METTINKQPILSLSDKSKRIIAEVTIYLFIALFVYTSYSKFETIEDFKTILGKSPLIGRYNTIIAWTIPIVEMVVVIFLLIPPTKKLGLFACLVTMLGFTSFLIYGLLSESKLPCHCGGVVSSLSWQEHIWFNLVFIILAIAGLKFYKKNE